MTKHPAHTIGYIADKGLASPRATTGTPKSCPLAKANEIAARYRHLVPRGRSVLFHGTKNARTIIRDDRI